ncbi:MAG TPA: HigA family addiction module antitoxin [Bryobacteraceae bacterium]|jgi:HTH-type transcriptional regulator/antitoxin HigA|nr:HigA family addiction module antitoxin [Bryobacteraceae bacterium]
MPEIIPDGSAPGEYIRRELDRQRLTQVEFAKILARPVQFVSELLSGKRTVTPETAVGLASAFGNTPQYWLNIEAAYQLSKISPHRDAAVEKRSRVYRAVPVKEMVDRRWVEDSADVNVLEARLLQFYGIDSLDRLDEPPDLNHAARQSTNYDAIPTPAQRAWFCRARYLARQLRVESHFSDHLYKSAVASLAKLRADVEQLREVPKILSEAGIRFLVVQPLSHTKIDGVCFWLDNDSPVVVLSLRYDRVDWFWHTLMHEMCHVKNRDGQTVPYPMLDTELVGSSAQPLDEKPESERRADECAVTFLVNQQLLNDFIMRVRPYYSAVKITQVAAQLGVHPGIVVGQLQHRREIPYSHSRRMLTGVKQIVTAASVTDGWGWVPSL